MYVARKTFLGNDPINESWSPQTNGRLVEIKLTFATPPTTPENIQYWIDEPHNGLLVNFLILDQAETGRYVNYIDNHVMQSGDSIRVTYPNSDGINWVLSMKVCQ